MYADVQYSGAAIVAIKGTEPDDGKGDLDCIMYHNERVVPTFFENFFNRPG